MLAGTSVFFPRSKLLEFNKIKKTPLEKLEDIEILRFLEMDKAN